MQPSTLDSLALRAQALQDRRSSVVALAAGLLSVAPSAAKGKSSCGKKVKKKCRQLASACEEVVRSVCRDECVQGFLPCCESLASCDGGAMASCFLSLTSAVCCD